MQQAMHAARLVAAQSALLALLMEQREEHAEIISGVTATLSWEFDLGGSLDLVYTSNGRPVAGEGM